MKVLMLLTVLLLGGCNTPLIEYTDPDHKYLTESPVPSPELTGYWVGMSSTTQENFRINPDGTGLFCSEYGINSSAGAIKVVIKDGTVRLINPSWYYTLTSGKNKNQKTLSSSLSFVTRDFTITRVTEKDLSLHCRQQMSKF